MSLVLLVNLMAGSVVYGMDVGTDMGGDACVGRLLLQLSELRVL